MIHVQNFKAETIIPEKLMQPISSSEQDDLLSEATVNAVLLLKRHDQARYSKLLKTMSRIERLRLNVATNNYLEGSSCNA